MLNSVQILRGIAATAVVLFHTNVILAQYGGSTWLTGVTDYGKLGVHLFFLLSGFIILKAHRADLGNSQSVTHYLIRRVIRIYPTYWVFTLLFVGTSLVGIGSSDFSHQFSDIATYTTLLPVGLSYHIQPPLKVAWTLYYEIKFYLLFTVALFSTRLALALCAAWISAILVATVAGYSDPLFVLPAWNLYFIAGMVVYWISERASSSLWTTFLAVGVSSFAVLWAVSAYDISADGSDTRILYSFLPVLSLMFLAAILLEARLAKAPHFLLFLGDASYSIYLVHSAAISVFAMVFRKFGLFVWCPAPIQVLAIFVPSILAGCVCFLMIERPILTYLRRFIPKRHRLQGGPQRTPAPAPI